LLNLFLFLFRFLVHLLFQVTCNFLRFFEPFLGRLRLGFCLFYFRVVGILFLHGLDELLGHFVQFDGHLFAHGLPHTVFPRAGLLTGYLHVDLVIFMCEFMHLQLSFTTLRLPFFPCFRIASAPIQLAFKLEHEDLFALSDAYVC
jgi:hypothetical protein